MFKELAISVASVAMLVSAGSASAAPLSGHIESTVNPVQARGQASLGTYRCTLDAVITLGDDDNPLAHLPLNQYNKVTNVTGTNDMSASDPECAYISVVGGTGTIGSGGSVTLNSLLIDVFGSVCDAGPVAATVTNVGSGIRTAINQATPCGPISANLLSHGGITQIGS